MQQPTRKLPITAAISLLRVQVQNSSPRSLVHPSHCTYSLSPSIFVGSKWKAQRLLPCKESMGRKSADLYHQYRRLNYGGGGGTGITRSMHLQYPYYYRRELFHTTKRREIVPVIGAAMVLVMIGRYSWRAYDRMQMEWEDYEWELQQYEKRKRQQQEEDQEEEHQQHDAEMYRSPSLHTTTTTSRNTICKDTISIDIGTMFAKVAMYRYRQKKPQTVISHEGDRSIFVGLVYQEPDTTLRGRSALERFYYSSKLDNNSTKYNQPEKSTVLLPWAYLQQSGEEERARVLIEDFVKPTLRETIDRLQSGEDDNLGTASPRVVATVPVHSIAMKATFAHVWSSLASTLIPDPVAAVWGAQSMSLLPLDDTKVGRVVLVLDVGASTTQLSLVQKDKVLVWVAWPWGGETWIRLLVDLLSSEFRLFDARSLSAVQMQARLAVQELSYKSRVSIHVPYLFPDPGKHHLDTTTSRVTLEQAIQDDIRARVVAEIRSKNVLSSHFPEPHDLVSLFTSSLTQLLEWGHVMPMNVDHVLVVGGGSHFPLVNSSIKAALYALMAGQAQDKLIIPQSAIAPELTALGAATILPNYRYSMESGLHRLQS